MEHLKKKKSSHGEICYINHCYLSALWRLIVYFLPRDGKFNYQFDINKPWKYGQLMATFDFPIYKDDAVVKREQDSLLAAFQPYFQLDKSIEKRVHRQVEGELSYPPERPASLHRLRPLYLERKLSKKSIAPASFRPKSIQPTAKRQHIRHHGH